MRPDIQPQETPDDAVNVLPSNRSVHDQVLARFRMDLERIKQVTEYDAEIMHTITQETGRYLEELRGQNDFDALIKHEQASLARASQQQYDELSRSAGDSYGDQSNLDSNPRGYIYRYVKNLELLHDAAGANNKRGVVYYLSRLLWRERESADYNKTYDRIHGLRKLAHEQGMFWMSALLHESAPLSDRQALLLSGKEWVRGKSISMNSPGSGEVDYGEPVEEI